MGDYLKSCTMELTPAYIAFQRIRNSGCPQLCGTAIQTMQITHIYLVDV